MVNRFWQLRGWRVWVNPLKKQNFGRKYFFQLMMNEVLKVLTSKLEIQHKKGMYFLFHFGWWYFSILILSIKNRGWGGGGGKVVASQLLVVVVPLLNSGWTLWLSLWLNSGVWSLLMRGFECLEQNIKIKEQ